MAEKAYGTAHIKVPDLIMTDYAASGSSIWTLEHNLNAVGIIVQCYDNDDELIIPDSVHLSDPNTCVVTWSEVVSGYALIDYIERVWTFDSIMDNIIPNGTWKVGTGGSLDYKVTANNDLETPVASGSFTNTRETTDYYYLFFTIPETDDAYELTEVGIFNTDGNIMFYSNMSSLYKPSTMSLNMHYRIEKVL